jgi:phage-related protein
VTVDYPAYGIKKEVEIVKTVWNPLKERYESLELNEIKKPLHSTLTSMIQKQIRRT